MAKTTFAQNGLVRIAYQVQGNIGPTVVILHGLLSDRNAMQPLADELEDSARVLIMDIRGHGGSSAVHGLDLRLGDLAQDVIAMLDTAEVNDPVIVVGVEIGAAIGQQIAEISPERVGDVILLNLPNDVIADRELLRAIAERAYKGQIEPALDQWLTLTWGSDWKATVPKPRQASARRSAQALHPILMALADSDVMDQKSVTIPGGTPFADAADLNPIIDAIRATQTFAQFQQEADQ